MKFLSFTSRCLALTLLLACSAPQTGSIPAPTPKPVATAKPSSRPTIQPPSESTPTPLPTSTTLPLPMPTSIVSTAPVDLYKGTLNEDTQNRYVNYLYAQKDGQGLVLWYNGPQAGGQGGLTLQAFKSEKALSGLPDLGPAVGHLDTTGNGMLAWYSALPANSFDREPTRYLYSQTIANFQPVGPAQKDGVYHPLAVSVDEAGNGWLLTTDERPPIYGNQQTGGTQYPDILHVQARQVAAYQLEGI